MSDYSDVFGREPEPWREPLGALRLTLWDESAPPRQVERARMECEALVRVLNERPPADQGKPQLTDDYDAGYAEGFHHGRSTPRDVTVTHEMADRAAQAFAVFASGQKLSHRELGVGRQAWIVALKAALGGGE